MNESDLRVLIVDDNPVDAELLEIELVSGGFAPAARRVDTAQAMRAALESSDWDLVLCDYSMPAFDGLQALEVLKATGKDIPFILISATVGEDVVLTAMRAGAQDFFVKGKLGLLIPAIQRELREAQLRQDRTRAEQQLRASEKESRRQAQQASAIADVGRVALATDDAKTVLNHACRLVRDTLGVSAASVLEAIEGGREARVLVSVGLPVDVTGVRVARGTGSHSGYTLATNAPVIVPSYAEETRFTLAPAVSEQGLVSGISTVIPGRRASLGVLVASSTERRQFSEGDVLFMNGMAHVLGEALESMRLLDGVRRTSALLDMAGRLARVGAWAVDLPGNRLVWSNEVYAIYELPAGPAPSLEEAIAFYATEYRQRIADVFERCVRDGSPFDEEVQLVTARGQRVWVRAIGEAEWDAGGNVRRVHGAIQDISASREAAASTAKLAERLRSTLESITDAFFTLDSEWRFTYVNREAEHLFRRRHDELLGRVIWSEVGEIRDTAVQDEWRRAVSQGTPVQFEFLLRAPAPWIEMRAYPSAAGLTVYARDVTAQHATRERIEEQAALLDEARDAIVVRDLDQRIIFWNKGAERVYGWSAAEAVGRSIDELLHAEKATFDKAMKILFREGQWSGEIHKQNAAGSALIVDSHWSLLRDAAGQPRSILTIDTDVTERKSLEQQFLRAQRMESIGTLAGGIAHDLNNLLMPILMGTTLLYRLEPREESQRSIRSIELAARRCGELVKQVLSFARGVEGSRVTINLSDVVAEVRSVIENTFPRNVSLDLDIPRQTWWITGDPTQINQVLLNLCVNARDAMPGGGLLAIRCRNMNVDDQYALMHRGLVAGRYVTLEVADSGNGMSKEVLDRVFEPFFTTKEPGRGTGLGLSTVLAIVRSHGGVVTVYSEPGKGTVFKVYLPANEEQQEVAVEADTGKGYLPRGAGELIMVVDDEPAVLAITRQTLEAFNYRVVTAEDGAQAVGIYALRRAEIAAVITDMMMPIMDGQALIAALRRIDPAVRIIASSGLDLNGKVAKVAHAGIRHFLQKPYSADAMLRTLREILTDQ